MANYAVTTQASALKFPALRKAAAKPAQPTPAGVPLTQQFHWTKPQTATFASSSGMMGSGEAWQPNGSNFVRPDVGDSTDKQLALNFLRASAGAAPEKPQFRSALEQVSFDTNASLFEQSSASPRAAKQGLLNQMTRFLRK